jgi:hypothetical protein
LIGPLQIGVDRAGSVLPYFGNGTAAGPNDRPSSNCIIFANAIMQEDQTIVWKNIRDISKSAVRDLPKN